MTKSFFKVVCAAVSLCAFSSAFAVVKIQHWQSTNGTEVYFVHAKSLPMLDVQVVFRAGSAYDAKQWGLAAFVNNMLGEATTRFSANQIADQFDRVGAIFNNNSGRDMASVSLRSLTGSKYLQPALATFDNVLAQAVFHEKSFVRVRAQTLATIKVNQEEPSTIASQIFMQNLYGNQAYGHPVLGTADSINNLTIATLKKFYQQFYVASNADIILVGNVSRSRAYKIANKISSSLPKGQPATILSMMHPVKHPEFAHDNFPAKQTSIVFGQLGITRQNKNFFPLIVGNTILGQLPLTSILFKQVRDTRGLAYYAASRFSLLQYKGPFTVSLKTRADKTKEAISVVKQTLNTFVKNGPTAAQLTMAKNYIEGSFPLSTASNSAILGAVTNIAFYHRPLNFLDTYLKNVNAVSLSEIRSAFNSTLSPSNMLLVTVGPNVRK